LWQSARGAYCVTATSHHSSRSVPWPGARSRCASRSRPAARRPGGRQDCGTSSGAGARRPWTRLGVHAVLRDRITGFLASPACEDTERSDEASEKNSRMTRRRPSSIAARMASRARPAITHSDGPGRATAARCWAESGGRGHKTPLDVRRYSSAAMPATQVAGRLAFGRSQRPPSSTCAARHSSAPERGASLTTQRAGYTAPGADAVRGRVSWARSSAASDGSAAAIADCHC
jgi:hypothetical protein